MNFFLKDSLMNLSSQAQQRITTTLAKDISAREAQVQAAVDLLESGATVPFIARYRKEVTGGLDDGQLRLLEERLTYLTAVSYTHLTLPTT